MRKLLVLLAAVTALVVTASPAHAVLYGQPDNNEHPYVGVIRFFDEDGNYLWRCTGTLISPTVVLTAGHCTFGTAWRDNADNYDANIDVALAHAFTPRTKLRGEVEFGRFVLVYRQRGRRRPLNGGNRGAVR